MSFSSSLLVFLGLKFGIKCFYCGVRVFVFSNNNFFLIEQRKNSTNQHKNTHKHAAIKFSNSCSI